MKILITGKNGQLSKSFKRMLPNAICLGSQECDLSEPRKIASVINKYAPDIIINTAAYTNVNKAEAEPELAFSINVRAVEEIAKAANEVGARLFHFSTDYVFDGQKQSAYTEKDITNPLNVYGATKLDSEHSASKAHKHYVFRISSVYGHGGNHFLSKLIQALSSEQQVTVVNDQIMCPSSSDAIAQALLPLVNNTKEIPFGLYHLTSPDHCSWYNFASYALKDSFYRHLIRPIEYASLQAAAANRPLFSAMSSNAISEHGIFMPSWKSQLDEYLRLSPV
jgi:dTDP-4-dehydrorhamnose reductase